MHSVVSYRLHTAQLKYTGSLAGTVIRQESDQQQQHQTRLPVIDDSPPWCEELTTGASV